MVFDPLAVATLASSVGVLLGLPGYLAARWLLPDATRLEAGAVGYGLAVSALVVTLAVVNLGLGVALTRLRVLSLYSMGLGPLVAALWWRGGRIGADPLRGISLRQPRPRTTCLLVLAGAIAVLAAFWAGHSNLVRSYPWPHHVDEYIHWGNARSMVEHHGLPYPSWLTGTGTQGPTDETGFWYLLSGIAWISGLPVSHVAIHGKLVFVPALAIAAWAYGSQDPTPFGLEAGLLVPLIPTTHRFLGPMFLVPMTVVLTLALAAGVAARSDRRVVGLPLALLFGAAGLLIHSTTAGVVALIAGWRFILNARSWREAATPLLAAGLFAAGFLLVVTQVPFLDQYWHAMIDAWIEPQTVTIWGLSGGGAEYLMQHLTRWATLGFGLGVVAAFRGRRPEAQALVLSLPPLLAIMITYERWTRGFASVYDRSFFYAGFLFLMIAGVGLAEARRAVVDALRWGAGRLRPRVIRRTAHRLRTAGPGSVPGRALLVQALLPSTALVLASGVGLTVTAGGAAGLYTQVHPIKEKTFYNTFPENETFHRFFWIRENLDELRGAELALLHPGHANEFAAITGLAPYSHTSHPYLRVDEAPSIFHFLDDGCEPLDYLNTTGAQMVVGGDCENDHGLYDRVGDQVYLYEPALPNGEP